MARVASTCPAAPRRSRRCARLVLPGALLFATVLLGRTASAGTAPWGPIEVATTGATASTATAAMDAKPGAMRDDRHDAADGDDQASLLRRAEQAERRFEPAEAAELYRTAIEVAPTARLSRRARARLDWLSGRDEGDWAPLGALMRMRATPGAVRDARGVERFADLVQRFPPGRVRRESLALIAGAWLRQLNRPERALRAYRAWAHSEGVDEAERQLALAGVALAQARLGRRGASIDGLHAAGLSLRPEALWLHWSRVAAIGRTVAYALLALLLTLGLGWGGWRGLRPAALRKACSPTRLGVLALVCGAPLLFIGLYDRWALAQMSAIVAACGLALALASLLGAGIEAAHASPRRRRALAALAALGTLAASFIALDRSRLLLDFVMSHRTSP